MHKYEIWEEHNANKKARACVLHGVNTANPFAYLLAVDHLMVWQGESLEFCFALWISRHACLDVRRVAASNAAAVAITQKGGQVQDGGSGAEGHHASRDACISPSFLGPA